MQAELHKIQTQILNKLLFNPELRYVDLRPSDKVENNKLNFHLKKLQELELIEKRGDLYQLTNKGKEVAGRLDTNQLSFKQQAKISAWICPVRNTEKGREYLIYTRLKSPFYSCQGFMSGKVDYDEQVIEAAERELLEETNLEGTPVVIALKHYRVFDCSTEQLLEDKFMFLCKVEEPTGKLLASEEGKYEWVAESELKNYVTNHFESWDAFQSRIQLLEDYDGTLKFIEEDHYSEKF